MWINFVTRRNKSLLYSSLSFLLYSKNSHRIPLERENGSSAFENIFSNFISLLIISNARNFINPCSKLTPIEALPPRPSPCPRQLKKFKRLQFYPGHHLVRIGLILDRHCKYLPTSGLYSVLHVCLQTVPVLLSAVQHNVVTQVSCGSRHTLFLYQCGTVAAVG